MLFCGLNNLDPTRYNVYCGQLELALKSRHLNMVTTDLDQVNACSLCIISFLSIFKLTLKFSHQVKVWLTQWDDVEKARRIYRLLHDSFIANEQRCVSAVD